MYLPWILLMWVFGACSASLKKLFPTAKTFKDRNSLVSSFFWNDVSSGNQILPQTTSIYIQRDRALLFISKVATSRRWFWSKNSDISMVEVRLEDGERQLLVVNYPLQTLSAEWTSSGGSMEHEVTQGFGITFSFQLHFETSLLQTGVTMGLGSSYTLSTLLAQNMVCRANPGGRVQLQASTRMVLYPRAITRNVTYKSTTGTFTNGEWENVTSSVAGETVDGALFYRSDYLGLHRCVTDPNYFEDALHRNWVELN